MHMLVNTSDVKGPILKIEEAFVRQQGLLVLR